MNMHLELAQGSRGSTFAGVFRDAPFIDGCEELGDRFPTPLLKVDAYAKLSESQYIRLSRGLGSNLRDTQVQLLKELCLLANCSEEFFLSGSKDQWLRTAISGKKDSRSLFSSKLIREQGPRLISSIAIHSIVVPWHLYWPKLQAVREKAEGAGSEQRVYFPSTVLEVALSEEASLGEKLSEWEKREEECVVAKQWHDRDGHEEKSSRPFWRIGADDIEIVNSNFVGGGQAEVWKISWRGGNFARKIFKEKGIFDAELEVVRRVSHPHIVYSFGVSIGTGKVEGGMGRREIQLGDDDQRDQKLSPGDETQHSLLMELLDCDLFALIEERVRLKGYGKPPLLCLDSLDILLQIAKAMSYMHGLPEPVIHGDLKPKNILVSHCEILGDVCQYFVKVADFGSARILESSSSSSFYPERGTTQYAAPEVLKAHSEKTSIPDDPKKIDVYSFGIVAFQILTGLEPYKKFPRLRILKKPYQGVSTRRDLAKGVMDGALRPPLREACGRPHFWNDPDLLGLVESCWHREPSARPPFSEVVNRLEHIYNNLLIQNQIPNGSNVLARTQANVVDAPQQPTVESSVHTPSQANVVDDAPQSNSTTRDGLPLPEVNAANGSSSVAQERQSVDQVEPKKASRRVSKSRYLLSWICISPGKTIE